MNTETNSDSIAINFSGREQWFLAFVFMEVFGGGSTRKIQNILGDYVEAARRLEATVKLQSQTGSPSIELTAKEWRVMYESLNAVIYGLGPTELHTCTGYKLQQACSVNQRICDVLWDAGRLGGTWEGNL